LWINYSAEMQPIYTTIPAGTESNETGASSAWTGGLSLAKSPSACSLAIWAGVGSLIEVRTG